VRLARSPWNRASKAASLCPQRSRQMDSPTDHAKKASSAAGRMVNTVANRPTTQVFCSRVAKPMLVSWLVPRPVSSISSRPAPTTTRKICKPRRTPISPS
jgi:hypothetical protein